MPSADEMLNTTTRTDPGRASVDDAVARPRWRELSSDRWLTVASVVAFILLTVWWLTQEGRVQDWDNGLHTIDAFLIH
ncbi:MAG TPA: hypothetical protein VHY83_12405, partial [Solirubrobacteraceae bacterium]|nr:hypothetical protein [Solirubrobacteraceae bacterium]